MDHGIETVLRSLRRHGLAKGGERPRFTVLTGGISSEIWRVETASGPVCVKRALDELRVGTGWRVPVARNASEVGWMQVASRIVPGSVPALLAHDPEAGLFVMEYLDPMTHPVWKDELRHGRADPAFAAEVGARLGRIHAGTAGDLGIARRFATDEIFHAIRLEAYLEAAGRAHPELAELLLRVSATTATTRLALVHGDISPKNILRGAEGPVFLDAECAWYGDPAFDLAFCLNHLLLKCLWVPPCREGYLACFSALTDAYCANVVWETADRFERRAGRLLPALLLARADGRSPAEYLTDFDKVRIRAFAGALLRRPADLLSDIRDAWARELAT